MYDSLHYIILRRKDWIYPTLIDIFSNNWRSWEKNFIGLELVPAFFSSCKTLLVRSLSEIPFFLQGPFSEAFFRGPFSEAFFRGLFYEASFSSLMVVNDLYRIFDRTLNTHWSHFLRSEFWRLQFSTKDPFCWLMESTPNDNSQKTLFTLTLAALRRVLG